MSKNSKDMPWRDAIITVLKAANSAMHYTDIADQIERQGLRFSLGKTPASTVSSYLNTSIRDDEADSPFIRTEPAKYMLRSSLGEGADALIAEDTELIDEALPVVKSVGMYWNLDRIDWRTKPKLYGRQQAGSDLIDFSDQIGIYLLYDQNRVLYVGRAVERPLGQRLAEHLKDRLNGRWNRFSWFGLRGVDESGKLTKPDFSANQPQIISLMEAILIEALEPAQNRKRGDDFSDKEYLQADDPALAGKKQKVLLETLLAKMGE